MTEPPTIEAAINRSPQLLIIAKGLSAHRGHRYYEELIASGVKHDVWTLNDYACPGTTLHFEMHEHIRQVIGQDLTHRIPWSTDTASLVLQPTAATANPGNIPYPIDRIRSALGCLREEVLTEDQEDAQEPFLYIGNTVAYMLALALVMGNYKEIRLYGVDFNPSNRNESTYERPGVEWLLGWAHSQYPGLVKTTWESYLYTTRGHERVLYE